MSKNSIVQICVGIILTVFGIIRFIILANFLFGVESVSLGLGILLYELAKYLGNEPKKYRIFTFISSVFLILGFALMIYNTFFV